jgi:hypothetical protein
MNTEKITPISKVADLQALHTNAISNMKELARVLTIQEEIKADILSEIRSLSSDSFKETLEELLKSPGQMILVLNMLIQHHNRRLESDNTEPIVESEATAVDQTTEIVESEATAVDQTTEIVESEATAVDQTTEIVEVANELSATKIDQSAPKPLLVIEEQRLFNRLSSHQPLLLREVLGSWSLPDGFNLQEFLINYSNLDQVILSSTTTVEDNTVLYKYPNFYNKVIATKRAALKTNSTIQAVFQVIAQQSAKPSDFNNYEKVVNYNQLCDKLQVRTFLELYKVEKTRGFLKLTPTQKLIEMLTPELEEESEDDISTSSGFTPLESISPANLDKLSGIIKKR